MLETGQTAPDFTSVDQNGDEVSLASYSGKKNVVLYFYPKDDTPGCTTEACAFRDDVGALRRLGVALLGISTDDVKSHKEFADKYHLPFSLLSDAEGDVARAYGSLHSFGPLRFARRNTFIIDPQGRIAQVFRSVRPEGHSREVIEALQALMPSPG